MWEREPFAADGGESEENSPFADFTDADKAARPPGWSEASLAFDRTVHYNYN